MERIAWLILGLITLLAAVRARQSLRAMRIARIALGVLMIAFGAAVNAVYLASASGYYDHFADSSPFPLVRDTWNTVVLPNQGLFIGILIAFEFVAGALILSGGRYTQIGLLCLIGFHLGQLAFGGVLWPWAVTMLIALTLLLRAERNPPSPATAIGVEAPRWSLKKA